MVILQLRQGFHPQTQLEKWLFNEFLIQDTSAIPCRGRSSDSVIAPEFFSCPEKGAVRK
jgi:hypothetical protein